MKSWHVYCGCGYLWVQLYNKPLPSECPKCGPEEEV